MVAGEVGFEGWFPLWIRNALRDPFRILVPLALSFLGVAAYLLARRRSSGREQYLADPAWWIALPLVLAVLAWFLSAPSPLYAVPFFWSLAALIWSQAYRRRLAGVPTQSTRVTVVLGALLGVSTLAISPMFVALQRGERPFAAIAKANLNRPGADLWFQPIAGRPELSPYRTQSGLLLNTVPNRCWDAPLPCTPNPAANLRLRDSSNMAKGFVVDGSWAMENWPLNTQPDFLAAWRRSRIASSR